MNRILPASLLRQVGNFIQTNEKLLLAALAVVIVITGGIWYRQYFSIEGPVSGGTYVDGIVGGIDELDAVAAKLTKVGLFSVDESGEIQNQLIEHWSVNADNTEYRFDLLPSVEADEIVSDIRENLDLFGPAEVSSDEGGTVVLNLSTPNPNIPILMLQPLFDYGPYKLSKMSSSTAIFTRNTNEVSPNPYINKVVVHTFPDEDALKRAIERKRIDGARVANPQDFDGYDRVVYPVPNYYAVILNINRSPFREEAFRRKVVSGQPVSSEPVVLTVADEDRLVSLASQVKAGWESQGLSVDLDIQPTEEISLRIGPTRNFQALFTGISYAPELDPFYLWHSSQIRPPGNNLSGIRSPEIDELISDIGQEYSLLHRYQLINQLHQQLNSIGILQIIEGSTDEFLISNKVVATKPYLPISIRDRWQTIAQWYLR